MIWLSRITMTCFAASYALGLILEISRLFFRARIRNAMIVGVGCAGLFAHTVFLWTLVRDELGQGVPLARWYDWCLMAAWLVTLVYLVGWIRRPENAIGVFLLPLVLMLIGVAAVFQESPPFSRAAAVSIWGMVHGLALLSGTVIVVCGFAAGVMYLIQSHRLKKKLPPIPGLKLPSLELLQTTNQQAMFYSTVFLAVGLAAGFFINLIQQTVAWASSVVVSSSILLVWLLVCSLFEFLYKPARRGRKVAYMTVASFVFLAMVLAVVLLGQHAAPGTPPAKTQNRTQSPSVVQPSVSVAEWRS